MRVISKSNASSLDYGGATYEPGPDGVFNFPEPVGLELTTKHASMWVAEDAFKAAATAAQRDALRDPNFLVSAVADLLGRVAALEAKHLASDQPAPPEAETPPPPSTEAVGEEQEPASTAKKAAAKKAPAKKTAASKPDPADSGTHETQAPDDAAADVAPPAE